MERLRASAEGQPGRLTEASVSFAPLTVMDFSLLRQAYFSRLAGRGSTVMVEESLDPGSLVDLFSARSRASLVVHQSFKGLASTDWIFEF